MPVVARRTGLHWLIALLAVAIGYVLAAPQPAAAGGRPVLLMFHAGGFVFDTPDMLEKAVPAARQRGFRAIRVTYTEADPAAALDDARKAAERFRGRRVYAYGESAGGSLAARLAQLGLVRSAATYSPVADVSVFAEGIYTDEEQEEGFLGTEAEQRRVSPTGKDSQRPILALAAAGESPPLKRAITHWARSDTDVIRRVVPGDHLGTDGEYEANMDRGLDWIAAQAGLSSADPGHDARDAAEISPLTSAAAFIAAQ
jgi:acetyl esterase/lipase